MNLLKVFLDNSYIFGNNKINSIKNLTSYLQNLCLKRIVKKFSKVCNLMA